jgi:hypothetical protein
MIILLIFILAFLFFGVDVERRCRVLDFETGKHRRHPYRREREGESLTQRKKSG